MATSCFNVNDPAYGELMEAYNNNNILVDSIITSYQSKTGTDLIPSVDQASEMLRNQTVEREIDSAKVAYYQTVTDQATSDAQRSTITNILEFTETTDFDSKTHTYTDKATGEVLKSTTRAITGTSSMDDYLINREIGNLADRILEGIITGKRLDDISLEYYDAEGNKQKLDASSEILNKIWMEMESVVRTHTEMGSVLIPQVVVKNSEAGIAGTIDILVVKKNGSLDIIDLKTSKNSIKEKNEKGKVSYYHSFWPLAKDSVIREKGGATELSKRQQHVLQVNVYTRMLEAAGFQVTEAYTQRFNVKLNEGNTGLTDITDEGRSENMYYEESVLADLIIPETVHYKSDPIAKAFAGQESEKSLPQKEFAILLENNIIKPLSVRLKELSDLYKERVNLRSTNNRLFIPKAEDTIDKLQDLLFMLEKEGKSGRAILAYSRFLKYAIEDMTAIVDFLSSDANVESERASGIITNATNFVETYKSIADSTLKTLEDQLPPEQQKLLGELRDRVYHAKATLQAASEKHVKYIIRSGTAQQLSDQEIEEALKESQDISSWDSKIGDIDTSTDVLLRIIAKTFKRQLLTARDNSREFNRRADLAAADLIRLSPGKVVDYGFMYDIDANGKLVVIDPYSMVYYNMETSLRETLYDSEGNWITYYEVSDPLTAKPEYIEHNKKLFEKREKYSEFRKAEIIQNGRFTDGKYHKYTDQFKESRSRHEYFNGRAWVRRAEVSDVQYRRFRNKYYEVLHDAILPVRSGNGYTGAATVRTIEVPSRKYVEARLDAANEAGVSFTNPKYNTLMNPTTDLGRAQKKFYEFYISEVQKGVMARLPDSYQERYKHRVPSYNDQSEIFANIPTVPLRVIARLMYAIKDLFLDWNLPVPAVRKTRLNERGDVVASIPIFLSSTFEDSVQEKINSINDDLAKLKEDLRTKKIDLNTYNTIRQDLKEEKYRLEKRPKKNIASKDILKAIKIFHNQVSIYEQKVAIEDTFSVMREAAKNRMYYSRKKFNSLSADEKKEYLPENSETSRTLRRLDKWFKQIYYEQNVYDDFRGVEKIGVLALRKLTAASSLVYVGFNYIGNIGNYLFGVASNRVEAFGGLYFDHKSMNAANKLFRKDYLPNKIRSTAKGFNSRFELVDDAPGSKTEGLIRYFNMPRHLISESERGNPIPGGYWFQDGGEFFLQSTTGLAILHKIKVLNKENNSQTSLIDAYEWDQDSKELKLKEGDWYIVKDFGSGESQTVKYDEDQKRMVQNYIYEVNKQIHGNYADEDRVAIQDHYAGAVAMQFHKWVYPSVKAHFKRRYFDENLGWYEGRVTSMLAFTAAAWQFGDSLASPKFKEAWSSLEYYQKANIKKLAVQLAAFTGSLIIGETLRSLKETGDDDDEDDEGFFSWSRSFNSLLFFNDSVGKDLIYFISPQGFSLAESPLPLTRFAQNIAEAIWRSSQYPYYAIMQNDVDLAENKEVYYQRGTRKGQLKLAKEWGDVIPFVYTINRWKGFDTVTSDYTGN